MKRPAIAVLIAAIAIPAAAEAQSAERQISLAVMPLPEAVQAGAKVYGFVDGNFTTLREGSNEFICLADTPGNARFQVACYHEGLEPYMARGRELREEGITGRPSIERRWEEINAGQLTMPDAPTMLYQMFGQDPEGVTPADAGSLGRLTVVYIKGATAEETGLSSAPIQGVPWIMYPGTPTAHIMISS